MGYRGSSSYSSYPYSSSHIPLSKVFQNGVASWYSSYPLSSSSDYGPPYSSVDSNPHPNPHPWQTHNHAPPPKGTTTSEPSRAPENNHTASRTPVKLPHLNHAHHGPDLPNHLSTGVLAAAIVVPVLFLLSAIGLAYLCFRKRASRRRGGGPTYTAAAGMKEKLGSFRRRRDMPPAPPPATEPPVLISSDMNNSYYTGLDTSSYGSRGNSAEYPRRSGDEPPPPYIREPSPPPTDDRTRSPFADPEEDLDIADGFQYLSPAVRRDAAGGQQYPISSALYADRADLREAPQPRRSTRPPAFIDTRSIISSEEGADDGTRRDSNPFLSPVSAPGSPASGRFSDVSRLDSSGHG